MAIEKNSFKVARFDAVHHHSPPQSGDTVMSSDDEEFQRRNSVSAVESEDDDDDDDGFDECDSGAGSDDFDLLELGEAGEEFCQVGDQTCGIPYELYDLQGLKDVLSMEVWNDVLTEEERFGLAKYLPDMDQENFVRTLKEVFSGDNLHFGNPVDKLFDMLRGGLCEPRVALYKQGLNFFQRKKHYHNLRKHHNVMVTNLCQIRDAWSNCKGYSIEEKLRVLNIMNSQKSLMNENMEECESESSDREESGDSLWGKKGKDKKVAQKTSSYSGYGIGASSDISSRGRKTTMESAKHGNKKPKGNLKLGGSKSSSKQEVENFFPSTHPGVEMKPARYGLELPLSRFNVPGGRDSSSVAGMNENDDRGDTMYEVAVHRDRSYHQVGSKDKPGSSKSVKKREGPRTEEDIDRFVDITSSGRSNVHAFSRNKVINQLSDIKVLTSKASHARNMYDGGRNMMYPESLQNLSAETGKKSVKGQKSNLWLEGSPIEVSDGNDPAWLSKREGGLFSTDLSYKPRDLNAKTKKWKMGKGDVDLNANDRLLHSDYRAKISQNDFGASSVQNGRREGLGNRGIRMFSRSEDTESDSSERMDEDDDNNPLMRSKWAYPGGVADSKHGSDMKKTKRGKKDSYMTLDGPSLSARMMDNFGENVEVMKAEQKGKRHDVGYTNILPSKDMDNIYFPGPGNIMRNGVHQQFYSSGRNGHLEGKDRNSLNMPTLNFPHPLERRLKGEGWRDFGVPQSNYVHDHNFEDDLFWARRPALDNGVPVKLGKKGQMVELPPGNHPGRSDLPLTGCNSLSKKRKIKDDAAYMDMRINNDYLLAEAHTQLDDTSMSRKRGKNKLEDTLDLENGNSETPLIEMQVEVVEPESVPEKKQLPPITPTVLTGFSFSIIHLLSAVRMAIITLLPDDPSEAGKRLLKNDSVQVVKEEKDSKQEDTDVVNVNSCTDVNIPTPSTEASVPSLSVHEIVNRVKSNPGDPCILETQEPLQDLVRGVLKIFSSRTAPLGAKGWKPLVVYEKSTKSWSWIGPVSNNLSNPDAAEEVISPDAWGLPHKMLVKLVDSFANWLKNSQETLQQLGSLPAPPLTLMQINLDEKERFKDLRAQKSLSTISPSSEEVRTYFRKEELLRYLIPDRAFSYTAVDGKKSIVAPLRRCGGKPTSKARDHFMLKRDRPPHVTILCLVRDAAARLPGSIGTRADVCTLIRDSQYIVEDVSDAQVNQVVSGALDRLHYERDPCVRFDGERKLWVYLHREREEEDFEDDGTSSTKKWRRQKKETTDPSEQGDVTVAYPGPSGQSGFDILSDLNVEATGADDDKRSEPDYHNGNDQLDENVETSHGSDQGMHHDPSPVMWKGPGPNSVEENKLLCQENSTNEDFDGDEFDEPPA